MFDFSPEAKDRLLQGKVTRAYLYVLPTDTQEGFIINESNYLKDWELKEIRYVPKHGIIGGAVAKMVTGNFINVDAGFSIEDREFELYIGVDLETPEGETTPPTEYIKYGNFLVQRPDNNNVNDNTYFEALDYMARLNIRWEDNLTYPCTLKQLYDDLCVQAGIISGTNNFRNMNFMVENNQFVKGESRRDVLIAIASIAFTWARVDENNYMKMDFNLKTEVDYEIDYDQYKDNLIINKPYGPVNVIVLRNSQVEGENITIRDEPSIALYGETELVIADNPFAYTQAKRAELIQAAWDLMGWTYVPIKLNSLGFIFLQCTDKLRIKTMQGQFLDTYLFNHIVNYNGVVLDEIETPAMTRTETRYQFTPDQINAQKHTELLVDKHGQQILGLISETNELGGRLTTVIQNLDGTQTSIVIKGGNNKIFNSPQVFGYEDIIIEELLGVPQGSIFSVSNTQIAQFTNSKIGVGVTGTVRKTGIALTLGQVYTLSFMYSNSLGNNIQCNLIENEVSRNILNSFDAASLKRVETTFTATSTMLEIEWVSAGVGFYYTDLMLNEGDTALPWQPSIGETIGAVVRINYDGVTVESYVAETITRIDANGFRILDRQNRIIVSVDTEKLLARNVESQGYTKTGDWKVYTINIVGVNYKIEVKED